MIDTLETPVIVHFKIAPRKNDVRHASTPPRFIKQCVWNKGAFVLRVDWFKPGTVTWTENPSDQILEWSFSEQPVQTDSIWAASGRCIDRGATQYVAVLSVCGAALKTRIVSYPPDWPETNRMRCTPAGRALAASPGPAKKIRSRRRPPGP